MRISIDDAALARLQRAPQDARRALAAWARKGAAITQATMVQQIRSTQQTFGRTGHLSQSVQILGIAPAGFTVGPTASYAGFANYPTRPHIIRPRNAKALAFPGRGGLSPGYTSTRMGRTRAGKATSRRQILGGSTPGGVVFAKEVHHPGTRGLRYLEGTTRRVGPPLLGLLESELKAVLV